MDQRTRILIADDHPIFRSGLRQVIDADETMSVIAEADDGASALKLIREHKPDIVVLDINMPGVTGFDVVASMRKENLSCEVVLLTCLLYTSPSPRDRQKSRMPS